jgi:UDP-N-acetylmuramoyl-tripeptide--D-alanyl-D-alanine ligase
MTGIRWTLATIADAVGGVVVGDESIVVTGVSTDTRSIVAGDLFVPVSGDRFDGHSFIGAAMASEAAATLAQVGRSDATPRVDVADTGEALVDLAALRRSELTMPVIAITGSTGKTSTKDLLAAGVHGSWASPKSYNNEVGVPLTILATPTDATALVVEVGSRGKGHIRWLRRCLTPDVAIITNLGVVHLETFGSEQGLADAKYELIELLTEGGVAVTPADEARLLRDAHTNRLTFGSAEGADIRFDVVDVDPSGLPEVAFEVAGETHTVRLSMAGAHQAANAAAALGAAVAAGFDAGTTVANMAAATGSDWRMDVHPGRFTVVNDAYNANPQSVDAALRAVARMEGRSVAVLGPMAELGSVCEREHRRMGELAQALGFDELLVVGVDHGYALGAPGLVRNATDSEDAADTLYRTLRPGDVVLVKASRSAGLEQLAIALIKDASS